jgi:hypothetical protein
VRPASGLVAVRSARDGVSVFYGIAFDVTALTFNAVRCPGAHAS